MNYFLLLLAGTLVAAQSTPSNRRFIVKLKTPTDKVHAFLQTHLDHQSSSLDSIVSPDDVAHQFNSTAFSGFSGSFSQDFLTKLNSTHADAIDYVEEDHPVHAYQVQQPRAPWGLARISATGGGVERQGATFKFPSSAGKGVDVYVLDSGLQPAHPDFEGRAKFVASFVKGEDGHDYSGHGTHVAGTIAGKTYGVAKKANVYAIKVLDKTGMGYDSNIIGGIMYVIKNKRAGVKTVINMSLGGHKSRALDEAVSAAVKAGIVVVVAAGNDHVDACSLSPSGAKDALAVGATDQRDRIARFSNFGKCVRMYAPGVNIPSTSNNAQQQVKYMSGTSMASPHVAGVAALLMSEKQYSSAYDVLKDMEKSAKPFAKSNDQVLLMASVPSGNGSAAPADEPLPEVHTEPERRLPVQRPTQPIQRPTEPVQRPPTQPVERVAPRKPIQKQQPRIEPTQDEASAAPPSNLDAAPEPSIQDGTVPQPSNQVDSVIIPAPDGRGSSWMDRKDGPAKESKKPCTKTPPANEDAPVDKSTPPPAADDSTTVTPPADNSTVVPPATNVTAPVDNSTTVVPPVDDSTALAPPAGNSTAPVDNSTTLMPPADNSTVLPPVDNSTALVPPTGNSTDNSTLITPPASNITAPLDNSTTLLPPADNATLITPPTSPAEPSTPELDRKCTDGAFKCQSKGFAKCDHGRWVPFQCAPGTECQQTSADVIICNYPTTPKKDCDTLPSTNVTLPLPSTNSTNSTAGNDLKNITLPGFELPSTNRTNNVTLDSNNSTNTNTTTAPVDTNVTVPLPAKVTTEEEVSQLLPADPPKRQPWESSSDSIATPASL